VPTGNFGDILAGFFAKRMGLPAEKLVIATNANDILHRFWESGKYEKKPVHGKQAEGGISEDGAKAHESGVKETLSPAMDILVSSNFERLLWFLSYDVYSSNSDAVSQRRSQAGDHVRNWLNELKSKGGFSVDKQILEAAQSDFFSYRVSDEETIDTIKYVFAAESSKSSLTHTPPLVSPQRFAQLRSQSLHLHTISRSPQHTQPSSRTRLSWRCRNRRSTSKRRYCPLSSRVLRISRGESAISRGQRAGKVYASSSLRK
jgi:hypothetical protein